MFGLHKVLAVLWIINTVTVSCQSNNLTEEVIGDGTTDDPSTTNPTTLAVNDTTFMTQESQNDADSSTTVLSTEMDVHDNQTTQPTPTETSASSTDISSEETTETLIILTSLCDSNPCKNGATCEERGNEVGYECHCASRYVGRDCDIVDECILNEKTESICENGACVYSEGMERRFCSCFAGTYWNANTHECQNPNPPCFPNPCHNDGDCTVLDDGSYECMCVTGYIGSHCEIIDECSEGDSTHQCENGYCVKDKEMRKFYCQCYEGLYYDFDKKSCIEKNSPCVPNPCGENGACNIIDDSYNCTCKAPYTGKVCDILNECDSERCIHGVCRLSQMKKLQYCECNSGYFFDEQTKNCTEVQVPCLPNPCKNKGKCLLDGENGYNCSCEKGYSGKNCDIRDLCKLNGGDSFCNSSQCITDAMNMFYCECEDGFYFDYANRLCKPLDMCPLIKCDEHETCQSNTCICEDGFNKKEDTGKCEPDFCSKIDCPSKDMLCIESDDDGHPENFQCDCPDGSAFDGSRCNSAWCTFRPLNYCSQLCTSLPDNKYECDCYDKFTLQDDNKTCEYAEEDNTPCVNVTCAHGTCIKIGDIEKCECPSGFIERDGDCVDLCSADSLPPGICPDNKCETVKDIGFRCQCEGKFQLSEDGVTCTLRKLCAEGERGWKQCQKLDAVCVEDFNGLLGFNCECPSGSMKTNDGNCQDRCKIAENQEICSKLGGSCDVDLDNKLTCRCPIGFKSIKKGEPCNVLAENSFLITLPIVATHYQTNLGTSRRVREIAKKVNINYRKVEKDVTESMTQLFKDFQTVHIVRCKFTGEYMHCKMELQFKETSETDLNRITLSSVCKHNSTLSLESCLLPPRLVLRKDKIPDEVIIEQTDICDEDIKEDICGRDTICLSSTNKQSFKCTCKNGYKARFRTYPVTDSSTYIDYCSDINECEEGNPCPDSTLCVNTEGDFDCICRAGYREKDETTDKKIDGCVKICDPNPCIHGDCDATGNHTFECSCGAGYTGSLCNFEDKFFKDAKINTAIVGAVLGGILLITILLFVSSVTRLRKKKLLDSEPAQILYTAEMTERHPIRTGATNKSFERDL